MFLLTHIWGHAWSLYIYITNEINYHLQQHLFLSVRRSYRTAYPPACKSKVRIICVAYASGVIYTLLRVAEKGLFYTISHLHAKYFNYVRPTTTRFDATYCAYIKDNRVSFRLYARRCNKKITLFQMD